MVGSLEPWVLDGVVNKMLMRAQRVRLTLRSSPSSLSNVEATAYGPGVGLARLCVYKPLLCLDDCARLALVVYTENLAPDLESATLAGSRNGLVELKLALAVEHMLSVELGYAIDGLSVRPSVEVNYFLVGVLEGQDDRICRECSKFRVQLLMQRLA